MDEDQLVRSFEPQAQKLAHRYFIRGQDRDDVLQHARMGVLSGIRTYNPTTGTPLSAHLWLCAERSILDGIKTQGRHKQKTLNDALHLQQLEPTNGLSVLDTVLQRERVLDVFHAIVQLTPAERQALDGMLAGLTLHQTARGAGTSLKSVDNALQRARTKLRAA